MGTKVFLASVLNVQHVVVFEAWIIIIIYKPCKYLYSKTTHRSVLNILCSFYTLYKHQVPWHIYFGGSDIRTITDTFGIVILKNEITVIIKILGNVKYLLVISFEVMNSVSNPLRVIFEGRVCTTTTRTSASNTKADDTDKPFNWISFNKRCLD